MASRMKITISLMIKQNKSNKNKQLNAIYHNVAQPLQNLKVKGEKTDQGG
jgi:hypothetical protein